MAKADNWITSAKLDGVGGRICLVLFWIWSSVGLVFNTLNFLSATGAVGVGTSAYLTVGLLYWIGGMVMFGLGALVNRDTYNFNRPNDQ